MTATTEAVDRLDPEVERELDEDDRSAIGRLLDRHGDAVSTGAALLIFLAMVVYGQLKYGRIVQYSTLSNLLINNTHLVILAVGLTFVILTGGIDLSVGSVVAFSSVAGVMLANSGWNPYLVIGVMVLIGSATGLLAGVLIEFFDMQPFIATLATMFLARGLASTLSTVPERLDPDSPIREI
jgi:simple sugar transport system permease protein